MRRFNSADPSFPAAFKAFLDERRGAPENVDAAARNVLDAVQADGLKAVLSFTSRFDGVELTEDTIRVTAEEIEAGAAQASPEVREAIAFAAARIRAFHTRQRPPTSRGPTRPACSWAGAGRRWRPWASMCPAAARPIPRPC
jgi:histidinol dehydrogenase